MTEPTRPPRRDPPPADDRDSRRKAALRANLARRKAQARERAAQTDGDGAADNDHDEG